MRTNGDIPCYDDAGAGIILGRVSPGRSLGECLQNEHFTHIRTALRSGFAPWGDVCASCAMLRPNEPFADLLASKRIVTFQVEPTLACALACPACTRTVDVRDRPKPLKMSLETFETALRGLRDGGYSVEQIEYCGNGEPLNHPRFSDFVRAARGFFPETRQRLVTNGNFSYLRCLENVGVDEFIVSCDGARQGSYEKYRVNGCIADVFKFMADIPPEAGGRRQTKIWKYILFEFNDSDDELIEAQNKAVELGCDGLMFVLTHSAFRSQRYTRANFGGAPLRTPRAFFDCTPIQKKDLLPLERETSATPFVHADGWIAMVDEISCEDNGVMAMRGWVLADSDVAEIEVYHNSRLVGRPGLAALRLDVLRAFPEFKRPNSGFSLRWKTKSFEGEHVIGIRLLAKDDAIGFFQTTFRLRAEG